VGRTPLREALRQLQMENYVDVTPGRGASISKISIKDVEEIYDLVGLLGGFAAEIAAEKISASDKRNLRSLQRALGKYGAEKAYIDWLEKNTLFHRRFTEISGDNSLAEVTSNLRRRIYRYRFMAITIAGHIQDYIEEHEAILEALFCGKGRMAGEAMRRHVLNVKKILLDFLRQYPEI
jgi:DNA-binding GntR family transcriptional regulator